MGEGCHLEPDLKYGHAYLEATSKALQKQDFDLQEVIEHITLTNNEMKTFTDEYNRAINMSIFYANENRNLNMKLQDKTAWTYFTKDKIKYKLRRYPRLFNLTKKIYKRVRR